MINAMRSVLLLCVLLAACGGKQDQGSAQEAATDAARSPAAPPSMPRSDAPADARLYFVSPEDGATLTSPVTVEFGLDGMAVVPAGTAAPASGHHHVIIDAELPPLNLPIPADANYVHFGDGRTTATLDLPAGEHTLQLLLGDHLHIPHDPPVMSERITITVE